MVGWAANASQIATGTPLTYTITITSNPASQPGPAATATNIQAVLSLPAGNVTFVSADAGCFPTNNTVVCQFEDLAPGASGSRQITVMPTQAGVLQAQVSVSSQQPDADTTNNQAGLSTTVTG